jgi:hypothetical protein
VPSDINPFPDTFGKKQEQPNKIRFSGKKQIAAILTLR